MIFKVNSLHLSCLWGDGLAFQPRLLSCASCFNHRLLAGRFSGFWSDSEIRGAPPRRSSLRTLHTAHDLIAERTRSLSCSASFFSFVSSWKTKWLQSWNMRAIIFSSSATKRRIQRAAASVRYGCLRGWQHVWACVYLQYNRFIEILPDSELPW